jgi:Yip1 domain
MDLQTRVKNMLFRPEQEWRVIADEPADVGGLLTSYAAPLSAIPAVCGWIGGTVIGLATLRLPLVRGFTSAIVSWVFGLVACWLAAIVIEKLAPSFKSRGSTVQALKLVVYASTPVWIAGVLSLVPPLAGLVLFVALYALYLFYIGLPTLMQTPADQVIPYIVVSALVVIVVTICAGYIASQITGVGRI